MHGPQKYSVFHLTLIAESTVVFFFSRGRLQYITTCHLYGTVWDLKPIEGKIITIQKIHYMEAGQCAANNGQTKCDYRGNLLTLL